jgi:uncharacterized protein (TIGR03905 family)
MKHLVYNTQGTCSRMIDLTLSDDNVVESVSFTGGCNGNLQGLSQLVKGMRADEVIARLKGLQCGNKGTSCPDQLCCALEQMLKS